MDSIEKALVVNVPVRTAYDQWTHFEEFPEFMRSVKSVIQLDDRRLHWQAEVGGRIEEWDAEITEQIPDRHIAWRATGGAANAGSVTFATVGDGQTTVSLEITYEPASAIEKVGDALGMLEREVQGDLERFKEFIEARHVATGAWRGRIHDGEVDPSATVSSAHQSPSTLGR